MLEEKLLEKLDICDEILKGCRNELYVSLRFLDVALSGLSLQPDFHAGLAATDGERYRYDPESLIDLYKAGEVPVNRAYLHSVFHCLFGHIWNGRGNGSPQLWDLSCDIAVESVIDSLPCRCLRNPPKPYRRAVYDGIRKKVPAINAEGVFYLLGQAGLDARAVARMVREFAVDSHFLWREKGKKPQKEQQDRWKDVRDRMQTEIETFSKEAAEGSKGLLGQLHVENRERYDYRDFLRKFCVLKEEMQADLDSFDLIFYHYGMELYGNMPLIEPQETREAEKIEDFVIVIDTSMSCKERLVRKFLEETYSVLSQSESFFRKFCIHILQCDERVQSDVVVRDRRQLAEYMDHFQVRGLGGTDFRPAFSYVEGLLAKKAFQKLRGLLYFTDGYGTFPLKKPPYDTAFVFLREDYQDVDVPPWAIKLILEAGELEEERGARLEKGEPHHGY